MIEHALKLFLEKAEITFTRNEKPKDRVEFSSTYDKNLIEQVKLFAKSKRVPINEIIEYSIQHIGRRGLKNSLFFIFIFSLHNIYYLKLCFNKEVYLKQ